MYFVQIKIIIPHTCDIVLPVGAHAPVAQDRLCLAALVRPQHPLLYLCPEVLREGVAHALRHPVLVRQLVELTAGYDVGERALPRVLVATRPGHRGLREQGPGFWPLVLYFKWQELKIEA